MHKNHKFYLLIQKSRVFVKEIKRNVLSTAKKEKKNYEI